MHKQNYTMCCKNTCCKQDNSQWNNFVGCKNYTKDTRNRTYVTGPPKGFVQNLKDRLVNLQNESLQIQSVKKPVKKKQKDYYCLMLRKINNLDKKLQNLENLFVSHLNHTPNEVFNCNNNERLCNYMEFYESVRSLVDLANSLKEDILYKQGSNNTPHRNVLHFNDRMQVLDSELQNLYTYLDQLQNYASEIKDAKQYFVTEDYQNLQYNFPGFRGGPKGDNNKYVTLNGYQNSKQNKRKKIQKCNENNYGVGHPSPYCVECYECDEDSSVDCQCSICNVHGAFISMSPPGNRRYSPKRFDHCHAGPTAKNSDCSCDLCANERKKKFKAKKNNVWVSQSTSSCSCEICICNNKKLYNENCNSARIKIIKPDRKGLNEENLLSELQISYHEMGPSIQSKKKKKEGKGRNQDMKLETVYYQDIGPGSRGNESTIVSNIKSGDSVNVERNQEKVTKNKYSKTVSASKNQEIEMKNLVYYEVAPDLNIVTKRKNNAQVFYNTDQKRNKNDKKNKKKSKDELKKNVTYRRVHTENFEFTEEESSKKGINNKKNHRLNSEKENVNNFYQSNGLEKKNKDDLMSLNKNDGSTEKHLHIKFRKKKEFKESITVEQNFNRSPKGKYNYRYTNKHAQPQHRQHGGFCHFHNPTDEMRNRANKRFSYPYPYHSGISESDSFETLEDNESDYDSSSQYKLYICNDPNCVDKLNSDELIMLMNKTDLKSCGENLYQLNVSESIADLKSDVCEKCTIKEKTISVVPHKMKSNQKAKFIIKKETVECFNCKNKNSEDSSEMIQSEVSFVLEKNERTRINKSGSNEKNQNKDEINSNGSKNKKEEKQKSKRGPGSSSSSNIAESTGSKKTNTPENKGTLNKDIIVERSNLEQSGSVKLLRGNDSVSSKALELQGYGNMININIDRGSFAWNQQPGVGEAKTSSGNKNKNLELITEYSIDSAPKRSLLIDNIAEFPSTTNNVPDNSFRNKLNKPKSHMFHSESIKSRSALDVTKDGGKEINEIISVKSEIFRKDGMKNNSNNNIKLPLYTAQADSALVNIKDGKRLPKKDIVKKEISLSYATEKNPDNVIIGIKNSRYIYDRPPRTQSGGTRKKVINGVSSTRLKKSRLKFNKNIGSYLRKVSSVNSDVTHQAGICPDDERRKKPSYNQGRRCHKLPKHKQNVHHPRISSLSGIVKPQLKIIENKSYQNDFKIPPNECSKSRYKIASISNYLSSTVDTESSYSSVNWEKVAQKLKEEDTYYKNIV